MAQINVRLPDAMLEALDTKRGEKPRNVLIVELFEQYVQEIQTTDYQPYRPKPFTPPRPKKGK